MMFKKSSRISGNIFFTLFAAVAVVGALGIGVNNIMKGPVNTMVKTNQMVATEDRSELNLKLMMQWATENAPDCDADGTIEAMPWRIPAGTPLPSAPTGGGLFPSDVSPRVKDAWGTEFGYCTWDNGTAVKTGACADDARRRRGSTSTSQPFIAMISAGPNKSFETTCADYVDTSPADGTPDTKLISRTAGSDDVIFQYSYEETRQAMGDNWVFTKDTANTGDAIKTNQNLGFSQDLGFSGVLDLNRLGGGLVLSNMAGAVCNGDTEGHLFTDNAMNPPSLVMCRSGSFSPVGAAANATATAASGFNPDKSNCTATSPGPFVQAGQIATSTARGVWGDGVYLYVADNSGGLKAYSFDGTIFTLKGTYNTTTGHVQVWGDGSYVYSARGGSVDAYTFDGTNFTRVATYIGSLGTVNDVWGDGRYVYVAHASGLAALTFNGAAFTLITNYALTAANSVQGDGNYIYTVETGAGGVKAFLFNGTAFTLAGTSGVSGSYSTFSDGTNLYTANGSNSSSVRNFNGSTFTALATTSVANSSTGRTVWGDGVNVYLGSTSTGKVWALRYDGTSLVSLSEVSVNGWDIWGDGHYIYVASAAGGLYAYKGFECIATRSTSKGVQAVSETLDMNYLAYGWGENANGQLGIGATPTTSTSPAALSQSFGFVQIDGANNGACAVRGDGTGWCWGLNDNGQIGDGGFTNRTQPVQVASITDFVKISSGRASSCGIRKNGEAWCWGRGTEGQLGNGTTTSFSPTPVKVSNLSDFVDIATGYATNCGVRKNGEAWCWGTGGNGRLGNGTTTTTQSTPVRVSNVSDFISIHGGIGYVLCGLTRSGTAYCWGQENTGNMGNGTATGDFTTPQAVQGITDFVKIDIYNNHGCGIRRNGEAWCWGSDANGRLGNGTALTTTQETPSLVIPSTGTLRDFVDIAVGSSSSCAIDSLGAVWCWGSDTSGEIGDGSTTTGGTAIAVPTTVLPTGVKAQSVSGGSSTMHIIARNIPEGEEKTPTAPYAIRQPVPSGKTLDSHGLTITRNNAAANTEAGLGFAIDATSTASSDFPAAQIVGYRQQAAGTMAGLRLKTSTTSAATPGMRIHPEGGLQLNPPTTVGTARAAIQVGTNATWNNTAFYNGAAFHLGAVSSYFGIDSSTGSATATYETNLRIKKITTDDAATQSIRMLLNGTTASFYVPLTSAKAGATNTITSYSNTATDYSGLRLHRGRGTYGTPAMSVNGDSLGSINFTGDGNFAGQAAITAYASNTVASNSTPAELAFRTSATSNMTGTNSRLRLVNNGNVLVGTPTYDNYFKMQVGGRGAADAGVKVGTGTTCSGATQNGQVRYTGSSWEVCNGSAWVPMTTPGGSMDSCDGLRVVDGHESEISYILLSDGSLMSSMPAISAGHWFGGFKFRANQANVYAKISNTILSGVVDFSTEENYDISPFGSITCAVTKDGRVTCWGDNAYGQQGAGWTDTGRSVCGTRGCAPAKIFSNANYKKVTAGRDFVCALQKSGGVDCWGKNNEGQLGNANTNNSNVPVNAFVENIVDLDASELHACAVRANGNVYCWGSNYAGMLGNGTTISSSAPVKVSNITTAVSVSTHPEGACAILANGDVWCWGGTYGNIISPASTIPVQKSGISNAIQIEGSQGRMCVLKSDKTISCWGQHAGTQPTGQFSKLFSASIDVGVQCAIDLEGKVRCDTGSSTWGQKSMPVGCNSKKYAFVTSNRWNANFAGLEGADRLCQTYADRGNLPGNYKAWLSSATASPSTRFVKSTGDYIRPDQTVVANGWTDLTDGSLDNAITITEKGVTYTDGDPDVWSNTATNGTPISATLTCDGWVIGNNSANGNLATATSTSTAWTANGFDMACGWTVPGTNEAKLYCFQQ